MGIQLLTGFDGFEGATSRIGGFTPSALYARGAGKGIGVNGLGLHIGQGWSLVIPPALTSFVATVGFAFKSWSDKRWGGEVGIVDMYNGIHGITKCRLSINSQGCLSVWSYDAVLDGLVYRAVSERPVKSDAWHYIEFVYVGDGEGGSVSAYVNGRQFVTFTGSTDLLPEDDPDPFSPRRGVTSFHIGVLTGFLNEERHVGFDDVYAAASASVVGDVFAAELELEADDTPLEWTPVPGTNHKANVDDDPADDATTYNAHQDVLKLHDAFSVVDVPGQPGGGGQVLGIQLSARMRKTRTAVWRYQPWIYVDPYICYWGSEPLTFDTWTNMAHRSFWEAPGPPSMSNPSVIAGHEWTWEEVQAMKVGYMAWPPSFFFGDDYGDNIPTVDIYV